MLNVELTSAHTKPTTSKEFSNQNFVLKTWVAGDNDILHQHLQISSCPYDLEHPYLYLLGFLIAKLYSQKRALLGAHWEEQEVRSVPQRQQGPSGGDIKEQLLGCFPAGLTGDGTAGMGWDGIGAAALPALFSIILFFILLLDTWRMERIGTVCPLLFWNSFSPCL